MTDGFSSVVCNTDMTSCPLIRARPNSTFARQTDFDRECRNGEEVHCGDGFPMIVQKSEPTLGRPRVSQGPAHPTRYGSLGYLETEHEQLAMNPWGTQAGFSATIRKVAIESVAFPRYACPHRSQFHAKNVGPHGHCKRDRSYPTTRQFGRYFGVDGQFCG